MILLNGILIGICAALLIGLIVVIPSTRKELRKADELIARSNRITNKR